MIATMTPQMIRVVDDDFSSISVWGIIFEGTIDGGVADIPGVSSVIRGDPIRGTVKQNLVCHFFICAMRHSNRMLFRHPSFCFFNKTDHVVLPINGPAFVNDLVKDVVEIIHCLDYFFHIGFLNHQ